MHIKPFQEDFSFFFVEQGTESFYDEIRKYTTW